MENKSFFGYTIILVALLYLLARGTLSQPPKGSPRADVEPQETLTAHNVVYVKEWNETLVAYAQRIANKCIDDCPVVLLRGPYGAVRDNLDSGMIGPVQSRP
ncbi:CAP superfamily [Arabidopsis thaliana x Arabidopsis arenosa]|uniref:CAP superfamily n=1 Tax=Arabidopsis thaliana x Arabidopsis arenosa TaxID=1240361 RepID=A0A8T1ZP46_9BRAS|nr:CAP superfamily [Arabidopsis thaliana x Arabidopsis arenosa]